MEEATVSLNQTIRGWEASDEWEIKIDLDEGMALLSSVIMTHDDYTVAIQLVNEVEVGGRVMGMINLMRWAVEVRLYQLDGRRFSMLFARQAVQKGDMQTKLVVCCFQLALGKMDCR